MAESNSPEISNIKANNLTRRDFLKLAGGSALSLLLGEIISPTDSIPSYLFDEETQIAYPSESNKTIAEVWHKYGIYINSPKQWLGKDNLPWLSEQIRLLADTLPKLPPEYLSSKNHPHTIYLIRTPGSISGSTGGNYAKRCLVFYIPETFDLNKRQGGMLGEVYGKNSNGLQSSVCHEITHSYALDNNPWIQQDWNRLIGWSQDKRGNWTNSEPEKLIPEADADHKPWEDLAVSASRMLINPSSLSQNRINFFLNNKYYSSWQAVVNYNKKSSH